ncbi:MAG: ABC transporter permease [Eubacteriaceae bacterium]|jgi:peptide/nickel transport system permease protein|nr:ABC transporter permease [Eubacteriaceae bacterium]
MSNIFIKRTIALIATLLAITFLTFVVSYLSPGDPAEIKLSKTGMPPSPEVIEETRKAMGLDRPLPVQYFSWLKGILKGDMGVSHRTGQNVSAVLGKAFPKTLTIALSTVLLTTLIAIPIALLCVRYTDSLFDRVIQSTTYMFVSMPSFIVGLVLLYVLAVRLHWFSVTPGQGLKGYVMPVSVLVLSMSSWYIRQMRTIFSNQWSMDYVAGLIAKGISKRRVLHRHVLKNSLVPIITLLGNSFATLMVGATIVENIFSVPGIGHVAIEAVLNRDYPVIQGFVLWTAIIYILINFLIDRTYSVIDPRIRLRKGETL